MPARIEDYALIGDMQSAALVSRDGAVDWLCLPRFDAPAVFAGLLGTEEHGFWRIAPADSDTGEAPVPGTDASPAADRRRYRGDSLILEQEWDTPHGSVRVIDFMPPRHLGKDPGGNPTIIRIIEGITGRVRMRSALRLRFSYGPIVPWVHRVDDERGSRTAAVAGPDSVWLDGETETYGQNLTTYADFTITAGERTAFALTWQPSHLPPPQRTDTKAALTATEAFWIHWTGHCTYQGPYREAVIRSLITLKALTYAPTGGIVAAPTTSLPEDIGGVRNWDYRYT
ncbi:glycoside hydrolase family 15 protein, partial [Streptomyces sp. NPDC059900]|uniref:glycoside hydrolase family 15 protein n=1 Tax=Streptomyces sp. NPDC059900 TaxID=3155816 RepID=UPI003D012A6B